jgi:hypothetical protein
VIYLAMSLHGSGSGSVLAATALVAVRVVPAERGYTVGFVVLAGVFLLAYIAAYAIPRADFGAGRTVAAEAAAPETVIADP